MGCDLGLVGLALGFDLGLDLNVNTLNLSLQNNVLFPPLLMKHSRFYTC